MDSTRLRSTAIGFLGAGVILAALLAFVGVEELASNLSAADRNVVLLVVALVLGWIAAWGLALRTVLHTLGIELSAPRSFLLFAGAMFSNNVTPFGQAGGEPITALLISEMTDIEYERGLAAIASVDTLNFVPSILLALAGVVYFTTEMTLGRNLFVAAATVVGLAVTVPTAAGFAWTNRERLVPRLTDAAVFVVERVAAVVPRASAPSRESIRDRIGGFVLALERIAANPECLLRALGFSTAGWVCQMVALWLAFHAIDVSVPLSFMMFVVPIAAIAGAAPLPGGMGGIETALVVLLVAMPLVGLTKPVALAAVLIFRGAVYWIPTLLGGVVMGITMARRIDGV